jgi:hypothetical protein
MISCCSYTCLVHALSCFAFYQREVIRLKVKSLIVCRDRNRSKYSPEGSYSPHARDKRQHRANGRSPSPDGDRRRMSPSNNGHGPPVDRRSPTWSLHLKVPYFVAFMLFCCDYIGDEMWQGINLTFLTYIQAGVNFSLRILDGEVGAEYYIMSCNCCSAFFSTAL